MTTAPPGLPSWPLTRSRLLRLAITLVAGASATVAAVPRADASGYPARVAPGVFGVNTQNVFAMGPNAWGPYLDGIAAGGMNVVRDDIAWANVEPAPPSPMTGKHTYAWAAYDAWVQALAARGLRWQPIIDYSAWWESEEPGNAVAPPIDKGTYGGYAGAVAARYGRGGAFWTANPTVPYTPITTFEIWNEENYPAFWGALPCDPAKYDGMFLAASHAIRAVDSAANVVVGGLVAAAPTTQCG